jgi:hypothetical protein
VKFGIINVGTVGNSVGEREVAETVHYGLLALGHDCVMTKRWLADRRLILFGAVSIPLLGVRPPDGTILYNLEHVYHGSPFITPTTVAIFRQYPMVDFSKLNIDRLVKMGVPAPRWLPIGYVPELTRIQPAPEEDIDVLFYGAVDPRRRTVLDLLRDQGLRVESLTGVHGKARDAFIARSKVVLNMHYGSGFVFESVRVSYLLANRKAVVSERGDGHEDFSDGVAFAEYTELADRCAAIVRDDEARKKLELRGFEVMSGRSEAAYLKAALADFIA